MAIKWPEVEFGDVLINGTKNGIYKKKEFHGSGVKIVNMGELFAHPRLFPVPMKRIMMSEGEINRFSLHQGDLLFARRSLVAEGAGKCSVVMDLDETTTFESSIIRARPNLEKLNSLFAFYLFGSPQGKHLLKTIRRQVTIAGITGGDLVRLRIPLPPLPEQRIIAHILGSLDDKIKLNLRMNKTLEEIARTIFKSWFVDFDPVHARAEERDTGLPAEIADLFPDSFVESELGMIPRGWEISTIGEAVQCVGGSTPSTKNPVFWNNGSNPFVTPKEMSSLSSSIILTTTRHITAAGVSRISSGRLPSGTVLLSSRAPIGYLAMTEIPVSINQGIIAMICDKNLPNYYVLYWTETNMDTIKSNAGGTTFSEISKRNFRPIQIIIPGKHVLEAFTAQIRPLYQQIIKNLQETSYLASLRDTLLPKLISGDLRIPDAENLIKGHV